LVAVIGGEPCPWLSVHDTGLLAPDSAAAGLSRALDRPAVAVTVEDSDRSTITLFAGRKRVDRIAAGVLRRKGSGHPEKWAAVLPHISAQELAGGMEGGGTFAEEALRRAAAALGLPYWRAVAVAEEAVRAPSASVRLCFRRAGAVSKPAELPVLLCGSVQALPGVAGQAFPRLIVPVANRGPETRGVRIRLGGPAVEQKLIEPELICAFRIIRNPDGLPGGPRAEYPLAPDAQGLLADLPDVVLPHQPDPLTLGSQLRTRKGMDDFLSLFVHFTILGQALQAGEAPLNMRIECLGAPAGPLEVQLPVRILPAG